jgi:hypothetical protein
MQKLQICKNILVGLFPWMPSYCCICFKWFEIDDDFCDFRHLCGNCSGVGPHNQTYVKEPENPDIYFSYLERRWSKRSHDRKQEAQIYQETLEKAKNGSPELWNSFVMKNK